jgi:hypothetical protein
VKKLEASFFVGLVLMAAPVVAVWFIPDTKSIVLLIYIGFVLCLGGLVSLLLK